jgi:hypothetical protein
MNAISPRGEKIRFMIPFLAKLRIGSSTPKKRSAITAMEM